MGIPSVQVFLGEEAMIDGAPTWVDVSAYVRLERGLTVTRGSTYGSGAQPGTASLVLDNTDGRFTVGNVSSPLYPYVHLQSLVKMLRDGRPWFVGRIQSMPLFWPSGGDSECLVSVTLADRLARFGRMSVSTFPVEEIASTGPAGYWPMVETVGAVACTSWMPTVWPLTLGTPGDGTVVFGSGDVPVGDGRPVAKFTPGTVAATLGSDFAAFDTTVSTSVTLTAVFSTTSGGLIAGVLSDSPAVIYDMFIQVGMYGGAPGVISQLDSYRGMGFYPVPSIMDGKVHVLTFIIGAATSNRVACYVDGVSISPTVIHPVSYFYSHAVRVQVGSSSAPSATVAFSSFAGSLGHVAVWPRAVTTGEVAQIYAALVGTSLTAQSAMLKVLGWRGQATGAAIGDLWSDIWSDFWPGATNGVSSKELGSSSIASILGKVSASEAGTLYVDGSDVVTWKDRRTTLSPSLTLAAADIDGGVMYNCDIQAVVTLVSASQSGTTTIVRADDITTIGEISGSVTSISTVAGDGAAHASWMANTGPRGPYIGSLKVDLATSTGTALAAAITGDILAAVTLTGMPSQTPPNSTKLEITGMSETISATSWDVSWTTLPAGIGSARDLMVLDDATFGVLDSTHRIGY